ncbi:UDP-N-acetylmuramoyl-tripeptide--D-alanyl-D-alanine ligase [Paracoccaceae bacterium GXU_MW_L88]
MSLWTAAEAAKATGGKAQGEWDVNGVSIDTRTIEKGDLFVALKDQRDGHDFVAQALEKGAGAALVSHLPEGVATDAPLLIVDDVLPALEKLGLAARARTQAKVIAVTGSVGKTGTKEMLRSALAGQGKIHAAEKSYNNHWGVPLTLARMPQDTDFAVIEIGMNHPGEIGPLARMAQPHVAIVTTVAPVHIAAFENVAGIAREKAAIFEGLVPGGTAVINRDIDTYPILYREAKARAGKVLRFGQTGRPDYRLTRIQLQDEGTQFKLRHAKTDRLVKLAAPGRHLAQNASAVLAAVEAAGADPARAALALADWRPPPGRGARWEIHRSEMDGEVIDLIDESYNANPASMGAALDVLAASRPLDGYGRVARGRRIAILGDMLELGETEAEAHAAIAANPSMAQIDRVYCVGPLMRALYDALPRNKRGDWVERSSEFLPRLGRMIDEGDVVMVKGSLGSKMGLIVDGIKKLGDARPQQTSESA